MTNHPRMTTDILKKLTRDLTQTISNSYDLRHIADIADKVKHLDRAYMQRNVYPIIDGHIKRRRKTIKQSEYYCMLGDGHLNDKEYFAAIEYYNKAICFAPPGTHALSLAYASRSGVYYMWGMYDLCITNIRKAREAGLPDDSLEEMLRREEDCFKLIHNSKIEKIIPSIEPTFEYEHHKTIPFVVDCVEFAKNSRYGRHLIASRDLRVGQIVMIEDPYVSVALASVKYMRCANCLKENRLNLIPCTRCTCAMFCTVKCRDEADKNFHQYECSIIDALHEFLVANHLVSIRVILRAVRDFGSAEALTKYVSSIKERDLDHMHAFKTNFKSGVPQDLYKPIHGLVTNDKNLTSSEIFLHTLNTGLIYRLLMKYTPLSEVFQTQAQMDCLMRLIYRHSLTTAMNGQQSTMLSKPARLSHSLEQPCGWGLYPVCGLLNHSCAPNTYRIKLGQSNMMIVAKPIKQGFQLFDSYGFHHSRTPREERVKFLELQYKFQCRCIACHNNYPLSDFDIEYPNNPVVNTQEALDAISAFDRKYAIRNIVLYSQYLESVSQTNYPKYGLDCAEDFLNSFYQIAVTAEADIPMVRKSDFAVANAKIAILRTELRALQGK